MAYKPIIHEGFKGDNGLINNWFFKGIEIMAEVSLSFLERKNMELKSKVNLFWKKMFKHM